MLTLNYCNTIGSQDSLKDLCRFTISYLWWLVSKRACTENSRNFMFGTWLLEASRWKDIKALSLYKIVHGSFIISFMLSLILNYIIVCRYFKVCILIWVKRCTENQIFYRNSFFPSTDNHVCLLINRLFTRESNVCHKVWLHCKLVKKTKNIAIYLPLSFFH